MNACVVVFPGSNCDRDVQVALRRSYGREPLMVWHAETDLPESVDLIVLPGGFAYGDYLRCGAIPARAPVMAAVRRRAGAGVRVLGICNGFQILTEAGLLPGALMPNAGLRFVCREVSLRIEAAGATFAGGYAPGDEVRFPIAHRDGNYVCDAETLSRIEGEGRVAFRYVSNPNGSINDIAGIVNAAGNVMGLMPHPERSCEPAHGGADGRALFDALAQNI